jgi:hypothetical protein
MASGAPERLAARQIANLHGQRWLSRVRDTNMATSGAVMDQALDMDSSGNPG